MTTSYIPITVNLSNPIANMSGADTYTSGLAIQNQANTMLSNGASMSAAQSFVTNALSDLNQNGNNSAYYTPGDPTRANASVSTSSPSWLQIALGVLTGPMTGGALINNTPATQTATAIVGSYTGWNLSRVVTIIIGMLLLLGAVVMFATNKTNVVELASSVAKNPEVLA